MAEVMQVMAFDCDLNHAVETQPLPNVLVKGDKDAHEVRVTVMRGDTPVSIDGATVTGTGIMGMNVAVATGKAAGNVASFVLNEGFYAQHGEITLLLTVTLDGVETTVFRGVGNVLPSGSGKTVIDPGDVLGWGELQNAAKEATQAAAKANTAANEASAAATNANDKANAAEVATANASAAAKNAAEKATLAEQKAGMAEAAANNANAKADLASQKADAANTAAIDAAAKADLAEEKAALADQKATAANTAAVNADAKAKAAEMAAASVNTAKDKAETAAANANREAAAAQTAAQNADSAASRATLAASEAEKQAAAAGVATSAADKASTAATQAAQSAQEVVQEAGAAVDRLDTVVADVQHKLDTGAFDGAPGKDAPQIDDSAVTATNPWSSLHTVDMLCPPIDAAGNPVACYPVAGYPLGVKASWTPTQEGAGEPSPENIRPIVGRDAVQVTRCGKNLLDLSAFTDSSKNGIRFEMQSDGYVHIAGTATANVDSSLVPYTGTPLPKGIYKSKILSKNVSRKASAHIVVYKPSTGNRHWYTFGSNVEIEDGGYVVYTYFSVVAGVTVDDTVAVVLTAADIEGEADHLYTGTTATLALPRTIYGGEVNAVTGEGAEMWKVLTFDGTESWSIGGGLLPDKSDVFYTTTLRINDAVDEAPNHANQVCSHYPYGAVVNNGTIKGCALVWKQARFRFDGMPVDSVADWKAYLSAQHAAGTPVQFAYKLATPVPFTATGGAPLPALAGTNTVLTDGDTVQVTGRADIGHALAALTGRSAEAAEALELLLSGDTGVQLHEA